MQFLFIVGQYLYPSAVIASPVDSSGYYVLGLDSTWNINVRNGRRIVMDLMLDLPTEFSSCAAANITIHGLDSDSALLSSCGTRIRMYHLYRSMDYICQ